MTSPLGKPSPLIPQSMPFQPISHPVLPIQKEPEFQSSIKAINDTSVMIQKLVMRINSHQIAGLKRQRNFEICASDEIECMKKDMNLLRGHLNKANNRIDELQERLQEGENGEPKSETVDQIETRNSRQAQVQPEDDAEPRLGFLV